jgi:hypothetical protein
MKTQLLLVASFLCFTSAHAQTPAIGGLSGSLSIANQERFLDVTPSKEALQDQITIRGTIDFNGLIEIHSLLQTGSAYNTSFNTFYNLKSGTWSTLSASTQLYLKQLYLRKVMDSGNVTITAGSLDTGTPIAQATSLASLGWYDGIRTEVKTSAGLVTLNAGQIKSSEPDSFERYANFSVNYFEITLKRALFEKALTEVGAERFEGKDFVETASKYDLQLGAERILHLMGEAKVELENGGYKFSVGAQDVLSILSSHPLPVKIAVNYEYVSANYDKDLQNLSAAMHTGYTGGAVVVGTQFPISKKYGVNGFTNIRFGDDASDLRMEAGVSKTLFDKSFRKKRIK